MNRKSRIERIEAAISGENRAGDVCACPRNPSTPSRPLDDELVKEIVAYWSSICPGCGKPRLSPDAIEKIEKIYGGREAELDASENESPAISN